MKQLKYVGAKPKVSQKGISFDVSKPDSYTFLSAAIELLETLDFTATDGKKVNLHEVRSKEYNSQELVDLVGKYCDNVNAIFDEGQAGTDTLISEYRKKVTENPNLTHDEKQAWLGNIDIMHDYYLQYMTNERAYRCLLHILADKIHENHIESVVVPLGRNYGLVLGDIADVLRDHKPPYDATMRIEQKDGIGYAILDMNRPAPLDI